MATREETQRLIAVMQAYVDGWDVCCKDGVKVVDPLWDWTGCEYRVMVTPDTIDWSHVSLEYNYMARDRNDAPRLYQGRPRDGRDCWCGGYAFIPADGHASYKKGNMPWNKSLVVRPGYEEAE